MCDDLGTRALVMSEAKRTLTAGDPVAILLSLTINGNWRNWPV